MQGQKALDIIKNNLICFAKMNEGLTGLERHEGGSFLGELFLKYIYCKGIKKKTINGNELMLDWTFTYSDCQVLYVVT